MTITNKGSTQKHQWRFWNKVLTGADFDILICTENHILFVQRVFERLHPENPETGLRKLILKLQALDLRGG